MNRRRFLQSTLALSAVAWMGKRLHGQQSSHRASVLEFGADPLGKKDSTEALRKAIASLGSANARLVFPAGTYLFCEMEGTAMRLAGYDGIEVYANNADLVFAGGTTGFAFEGCRNVAVHDMKLEWLAGAVEGRASALPEKSRPGKTRPEETCCLSFTQCDGVFLEGLTLAGAPGRGAVFQGSRDIRLDDVTIAPLVNGGGRTPTLGDALCLSDCHGSVRIEKSRFEGMGGDGIRVHQSFWSIRERLDNSSLVIMGEGGRPLKTWEVPRAGDFVQFSDAKTLRLMGEIAVRSVTLHGQGATLVFTETLSPAILSGMLVGGVVDAPKVSIDHCSVGKARGRGMVLQARADVTHCHFEDCGGTAILLAPDSALMEGPVVQKVNIRNNTFLNCNQGRDADPRGVITIDTMQDREKPETPELAVNGSIKIQENTFDGGIGAGVYAAGVDGLTISGNIFGRTTRRAEARGTAPAAVVLRNVANADVTGNIASVPQTIVMVQCADTVETEGNQLLTPLKSA